MNLREIRFKQQVSQWELSRQSGVHQSRISLIESGFRAKENEKTAIAKILGLKEDEISWPSEND